MPDTTVNRHYFDHVMHTGERHAVEAAEDIYSGSGIKLLAKGSRVDESTRERLLDHKLSRPLEDCLSVGGALAPEQLVPVAQRLLDEHGLLRALCAAESEAAAALGRLPLSMAQQSLLTVYAESEPQRLRHAVGVTLIARALTRRLLGADVEALRMQGLAGLLHDVGELYIDPAHLTRDATPLQAEQWKHIVTHPLVGQRVLLGLAGPAVARVVLEHHERLDGFGYPRGVSGAEELPLASQVLAAAEWLIGLLEGAPAPELDAGAHASVATRLIPGEFNPAIVELLRAAGRLADPAGLLGEDAQRSLELALPRAIRVYELLQRFRELRPQLRARIAAEAAPELQALLALCGQRIDQLQLVFSSAGLDQHGPAHVVERLAREDALLRQEVLALVREFGWRLRELERAALMRAGLIGPEDQALVQQLIDTIRGASAATAG